MQAVITRETTPDSGPMRPTPPMAVLAATAAVLATARPSTAVQLVPSPRSSLRARGRRTAGVTTQLCVPSSSSTARTASRSASVRTSTWFSRSSTTPLPRPLVLTCTRSPSARRSTSRRAPATSRGSIMPRSRWLCPQTLYGLAVWPTSECTPPTTMCCGS